ncbi:flagellar hook-length control protein FliK [Rhizobium paknamense]|uniref:Flagellar hook-length control protein-like C-terminal domain-containing protein n=1 Tax=Rhizobium paknamense TaxID=1206817 RepID=A0ABU0IFG8_9HYPH|nr:flagellar hook-length control protein FliK [Rhizobium paknamense]MDQ0457000.1 hypothetical protein [Rhizobium paknamense]
MGNAISIGSASSLAAATYAASRNPDKTTEDDGFLSALRQSQTASDRTHETDDDDPKSVRAETDDDSGDSDDAQATASDRDVAPTKSDTGKVSRKDDDTTDSNDQNGSASTEDDQADTAASASASDTTGTASGTDSVEVVQKLITRAAIADDLLQKDLASQDGVQTEQPAGAQTVAVPQQTGAEDSTQNIAKTQASQLATLTNAIAAPQVGAEATTATVQQTVTAASGDLAGVGDKDKAAATQDDAATATSANTQDALSLLTELSAPPQALAAQTANSQTVTVQANQTLPNQTLATVSKVAQTTTAGTETDAASTTESASGDSAADALSLVSASKTSTLDAATDSSTTSLSDTTLLDDGSSSINLAVLSSQRLIAPENTSNGARIAAALLGDSHQTSTARTDATHALASETATDRTLNTLKIKMTPESLGTVTATMKLTGGQLSVSLVVETAAAYRQLHEDQSDIVNTLKSQGFSVDQVQISLAPVDRSSDSSQTNNQNQNQNQSSGQQTMQGGSSGQNGSRNAQQQGAAYDWTTGGRLDDVVSGETGSASGSSTGISSDLYL